MKVQKLKTSKLETEAKIAQMLQHAENVLKQQFGDKSLLQTALTHRSAQVWQHIGAKKNRPKGAYNSEDSHYDRLEFLGDRILGLVIAQALFTNFNKEDAGALSQRLGHLVSRETLTEMANELDLAPAIICDRSQIISMGSAICASGIELNAALLADVMEALFAALYLEQGIDVVRRMILRLYESRLLIGAPPRDAKSMLQEWSQSNNLGVPTYNLMAQTGPDHQPLFNISLKLASFDEVKAEGRSIKRAQQIAAQKMLDILREKHSMTDTKENIY